MDATQKWMELGSQVSTEIDEKKAIGIFKENCSNGYGRSCAEAGSMLEIGNGTAKSLTKAFEYYTKACEEKNPWGCSSQARMYKYGIGVERNLGKYLEINQKLCNRKYSFGCANTGIVYLTDEFGLKNINKAESVLFKGCEIDTGQNCAMYGVVKLLQYDTNAALKYIMISLSGGSEFAITDLAGKGGDFLLGNHNIDIRKGIQSKLRAKGLYLGKIDGVFGPKMKRAMEQYCKCKAE